MKTQMLEQRVRSFEAKQIIVSLMCLLIFVGLSIVLNTIHLQSVAEESTRFLSRMVRIGDIREASVILHQARLSSFTTIQYRSDEPDRSFVIPPKAEVFKDTSLWKRLRVDQVAVKVGLHTSTLSKDEIIFEYERFRLVPYAILIWIVLNLISIPQTRFLKRRLIEQFNHDIEIEKKLAKSEVAQQVRHNLRTPLAALMRIPKKLPDSVSKDRDLLELTIGQIRDLISKLDDRPNEAFAESYSTDIYSTLDQAKRELTAIAPKTVEFIFDIEDIVASAFVKHIPYEFRSILGNIVTNSIEAIDSDGKILVRVRDLASEVAISVSDNGVGIKPESLPKIFQRYFSEGKPSGSGIGLSHAKENIEAWGGRISAESTMSVGTTVTIHLPVGDRANWYLPRLKFGPDSKIFVMDDHHSALELWRLKLEEAGLLDQSKFAQDGSCFAEAQNSIHNDEKACTFLFDYDLSAQETGLDLLRRVSKDSTRCLVTGNFDNQELLSACDREGIFLLPKGQVADIPIVVSRNSPACFDT